MTALGPEIDRMATIPRPCHCVLCRWPDVVAVALYVPSEGRQKQYRPSSGRAIGIVYGLCRACYDLGPATLPMIESRLEDPAAVAVARAGRG